MAWTKRPVSVADSGGGRGRRPGDLVPDREAVGHHLSVVGRRQQVPTGQKVRRDALERGRESLRVPGRRWRGSVRLVSREGEAGQDRWSRPLQARRIRGSGFCPRSSAIAVLLYHRFPLSFRDVQELMIERGVGVTYEMVRAWWDRFGQQYANQLRRRDARRATNGARMRCSSRSTAHSGTCGARSHVSVATLVPSDPIAVETHVVQPGDTLGGIAERFGVSLGALEAANPQITNPDLIFPGQLIRIPANVVTYVIQPGDILGGIADRFGVSLGALEAANPQITNPDLINPGQVIKIP